MDGFVVLHPTCCTYRGTGMESANQITMNAIKTDERRLILDRGFERAMETVLDAFLCEGFTINPMDAGDLHRPSTPGKPLRYALLEATLQDPAGCAQQSSSCVRCRLLLFELTGSCTLVTADTNLAPYAAPAPAMHRRVDAALSLASRHGTLSVA
jgi:hypothetical protein